jgi:hypothetical protein
MDIAHITAIGVNRNESFTIHWNDGKTSPNNVLKEVEVRDLFQQTSQTAETLTHQVGRREPRADRFHAPAGKSLYRGRQILSSRGTLHRRRELFIPEIVCANRVRIWLPLRTVWGAQEIRGQLPHETAPPSMASNE